MSRRKPPRVPTCPRCGNEEDLREWYDGVRYCESCIVCPHGREGVRGGACALCVRRLYSVNTFEGPRIIDLHYYVLQAWEEYSIRPADLRGWTFEEEDWLRSYVDKDRATYITFGVTAPPPHHRFG